MPWIGICEYRGTLGSVYQRSIAGFAVEMDESAARRLTVAARMAYVEQEQNIRIADTQEFPTTPGPHRTSPMRSRSCRPGLAWAGGGPS